MIVIGEYNLEWVEDGRLDLSSGKTLTVPVLHITKPDGEMMGCSPDNYLKLLAMLDKFWNEEF